MTLLHVWALREDVFVLPSAVLLCPHRMIPADFTPGRQYITLTALIEEKKNCLFAKPKEIVWATMKPAGFRHSIVTWISGLCYFGKEHLATFWHSMVWWVRTPSHTRSQVQLVSIPLDICWSPRILSLKPVGNQNCCTGFSCRLDHQPSLKKTW